MSATSSSIGSTPNLTDIPPGPLATMPMCHRNFDKCPRCRMQFDFMKRVSVTKVPLILPCNHTVCEDCIRKLCISSHSSCPVCDEKFTIPRPKIDSLSDVFHPHYTIIGYLLSNKNISSRKQMELVATGKTLGGLQRPSSDWSSEFNIELDDKSDCSSDDVKSLIFSKCSQHAESWNNLHCNDCDETACCYCFIENHSGHRATSLYKLSETESEDLNKMKNDIEVVFSELLASKRKLIELKNFDAAQLDQEIKTYFGDLHAKLLLAERDIRQNLCTMQANDVDIDVIEFDSVLNSGIRKIYKVLQYYNVLNTQQINLQALYEEVKALRDIPCRLESDQDLLRPIEFVPAIYDFKAEDCLRTIPHTEYTLEPITDWTRAQEKYEFEQMRVQTSARDQAERKSDIKSEEEVALRRSVSEGLSEMKRTNEGKMRIKVTHINNLNSFFVQIYAKTDALKEVNLLVSRRRSKASEATEFKLGGVYGVSYETKNSNHWRRGKLIDYVRSGDNCQYKVFCLDYGNTLYVTKEKLKMIEKSLLTRPALAFECQLTNINNVQFDTNTHLHLPQIIADKKLYLRFVSKRPKSEVQEVDLYVATSSGTFVSVRDLLVQMTSAKPEVEVETVDLALTPPLSLFSNSKTFTVGQEENVIVTHIQDPSSIWVQLAHNAAAIQKLKDAMNKFYNDCAVIPCIPVANSDFVVKYEDEIQGKWHRARVLSVDLPEKQVEACFVDWGKTAVVPWSDLRLLTEDFIKVEAQAIAVRLADIERINLAEDWSQEAIDFLFGQIVSDEQCKMVVKDPEQMTVALFLCLSSTDICLNSLLVERNYALSTGDISRTVYWPNSSDPQVEQDEDLAFQMMKKSEETILANEDDDILTDLCLQVSVLAFHSPDLVFCKVNKSLGAEDQMQKELQIHYSSEKGETKERWKEGEHCVVYDSVRGHYFRGLIKSERKKDYLVYLYDFVRELVVDRRSLFVLDEYFDTFPCNIIKCCISNVRPAGDAGKWSQLAIEMVQKICSTYKTFYVQKVHLNSNRRVMGVTMWYSFTMPAKALEPAKVRYISIRQALIEAGVAFGALTRENDTAKEKQIEEKEEDKKKDWFDLIRHEEESMCHKEESNCDEEESNCDEEEVEKINLDCWSPASFLTEREFDAILTCVDDEGCFWVRTEAMQKDYMALEECLTKKMQTLPRTKGDDWKLGNMCTILFEDKWYRGTVIELIGEDEVKVEMVDFGSSHLVDRDQLSKYIMFVECERLVTMVKLHDVYSKKGGWAPEDVETVLHIATDRIRVVIKGPLQVQEPYAEIYLDHGLSINDLIAQKCPHMFRKENTVCLGIWDDLVHKEYTYLNLSEVLQERDEVRVLNCLKGKKSFEIVFNLDDDFLLSQKFLDLNAEIQSQADQQMALTIFERNVACVCFHPEKKRWARGLIYSTEGGNFGYAVVLFVDYGTTEMIAMKNIKEIKSRWFELAVHTIMAGVHIELLKPDHSESVHTYLNALRGETVHVKIVSENPLKVHLYDFDTYYYQEFIDNGVLGAL